MILLYGAYGYTGELIARTAQAQGQPLVLAGRRADATRALAERVRMPWRAFPLDDPKALREGLEGATVVLHAAGPFARTARPMVDACLDVGAHYLDVTGEVEVFEAIARRDAAAKAAGVALLPGVGFDVVPTDCVAAHLKARLPSATHLELAFQASGGVSHGTASTMLLNLERGGAVREEGRLRPVRAIHRTRSFDFGRGPTVCASIPWGDLATAWRSTGIPNITTYIAMPTAARVAFMASRHLGPVLATRAVKERLQRWIDQRPAGPDDATRARARSRVVGVAWDDAGRRVAARLTTVEAYTLTALAALESARRALRGEAPPGYQTPATAFGADFILAFEGTAREDFDA